MDLVEARVTDAVHRGDVRDAADACFRAYGAELYGWLVALYGRGEAEEMYGTFSEALVASIGRFRGEASARTFSYAVARNVARRHVRDRARRRKVLTPLSHHPSALDRQDVRALHRDASDVLASLSTFDRELLILRVDRGFSFREIALLKRGPDAADPALSREEARLRKRFQTLRDRLRARDEAERGS